MSIKPIFKKAAIAAVVVINAVTLTNSAMIAHTAMQESSDGARAIFLAGTVAAPIVTAIDWREASKDPSQNTGLICKNSPIKVISRNTPDILKMPGGVAFTVLGAPGAIVGNLCGSATGFFTPADNNGPR